jgi:hypothetical protein
MTGGRYANGACTKLPKPGTAGKFEWTPLSAAVALTSQQVPGTGNPTFETGTKEVIACSIEKAKEGEYGPGSKELRNIVYEYGGCAGLKNQCNSPGQPAGSIRTAKLDGGPGIVKKEAREEHNVDGIDLKGQASEVFAEFSCGPVPVAIRGSIITKAQSRGTSWTNKMLSKVTYEYLTSAGKQEPEKFEGQPKDVLEFSLGGQGGEDLITAVSTSPKTVKIELRQCEMNVC